MAPRKAYAVPSYSIIVHVCAEDGVELGTITVGSKQELAKIAAVDWRPLTIDGKTRGFRYLGWRVDPPKNNGETEGFLWVSEAVWK